MAKFCLFCGAPLQPVAGSGAVVTCSACGKSFHDPSVAPRGPNAPSAKGGLPAVAWVVILLAGVPVVVAVLGIVAAIAIPNFIRFKVRAKQAECKATLKAVAVAQEAYRLDKGVFATSFDALGVSAPTDNRYGYVLGSEPGARLEPSTKWGPPRLERADLSRAEVSSTGYTALCAGNIDTDEAVDLWGVSSTPQVDTNGVKVAAGTPFVIVDDVMTYE
ncbi:MAG: type IV pilin-like G/H family protein [Myxococcaceae bacterium]|nr:type IV pilin-like G/H family protein [Myxococcaceae bacterium]